MIPTPVPQEAGSIMRSSLTGNVAKLDCYSAPPEVLKHQTFYRFEAELDDIAVPSIDCSKCGRIYDNCLNRYWNEDKFTIYVPSGLSGEE